MNTLQFSTRIEHGLIRLPIQNEEYENSYVRVIIMLETPQIYLSKREKLLEAFKKMTEQKMFAMVENPVIWQKQLRDEWE